MFQPSRNRDAYPSIRGYVYQIDRTVERWLALNGVQVLELERGEDIDLVGRLVTAEPASAAESRLLEQIKCRDSSITLRSAAALEAVANFHDHRRTNPGLDLQFCFLTNAEIGRERFVSFPGNVAGIDLWERVRTGRLSGPDAAAAVECLRRFLATASRPDGLDQDVWSAWARYVASATPAEFGEFVSRFEWSTGRPEADQFPALLSAAVRARGVADEAEIAAVVDRLFVHVARLLSAPGRKRLTVEALTRLFAEPTLPAADRQDLALLRAAVGAHADRLDRLEADVSALNTQVESIFLSGTANGRVHTDIPAPDLTSPPPVVRLSPRPHTTVALARVLELSGWVALHGGPDVGKSQLAVQVAAHLGCRGWARFRHDQSTAEAARVLEAALTTLAGWSGPPRRPTWYADALAAGRGGLLLVLDDLPRIPGDDPLVERLVELGTATRIVGVRVLSTSRFPLPARLRRHLGEDQLDDRPAPAFTATEAADLFRAYGAPEPFFDAQRLNFLTAQASGHPLLLTATAEFLAARNWRYRQGEVEALLRGDHARSVLPDVIDRLTRTLDDDIRGFLYRLTLPIGSFDDGEVAVLAQVVPPVDRPRERLNELAGAWVQRDSGSRLVTSPLVRPLGQSELPPVVRAGCYRALAEAITRRGTMNPVDCNLAIRYNLQAGEPGRATTLYVLMLTALRRAGRVEYVVPLIDLWRETPLPSELSVGTRLFVRSCQIAAFADYGLDLRYVLRDIDDLLVAATDLDGWAVVALAAQGLGRLRTRCPARVLRYVRRAVELPALYGPDGRVLKMGPVSISDMLWMLIPNLRTPKLLGRWLDAVANLPAQHRNEFWTSELARLGVWLVPNKVYTAEWEKPKGEQDWDGLLRALGGLLNQVRPLGEPRLEAALTGVVIEILGDRKRFDEIPTAAVATLARWPANPDVQFKVRGTWGRQLAYQKRPSDALALLDAALAQPHAPNDHERLRCLLAASVCVGSNELRYAEAARDLARVSDDAPIIETARVLGEYALSLFWAGGGDRAGAIAAYPAWAEAVRRFQAVSRKDKIWRDLFPLFAHATSYLTSVAREGQAPERAFDGGAFVAPPRGFLMRDYTPEREALYRESGVASVLLLLGSYATAAGDGGDSTKWMAAAMAEARRAGSTFVQAAAGKDAVAQFLAGGRFEDAVETGVFASRGMVVHHAQKTAAGTNPDGVGIDLSAEFQKLGEEDRRMGDRFALITSLIPAGVTLVRLSLTNGAAAVAAGRRVASMCRELASDEWGDVELWRAAAELFATSSVEYTNADQIAALARAVEGEDERAVALRVLGYLLSTWHAGPDEAVAAHLSVAETLLRWFPPGGSAYRLLLVPFFSDYWRQAARERRFAFRAPDLATAAIEVASVEPENRRVAAVLSAAASGFRIRGAHEVLARLTSLSSAIPSAPQ